MKFANFKFEIRTLFLISFLISNLKLEISVNFKFEISWNSLISNLKLEMKLEIEQIWNWVEIRMKLEWN